MKSMVLSNGLLNANLCPEVLQIPWGLFGIQDNSKKFGEKSSPHDLPKQEVTRRRPLSKLSLSCSVLSVPALPGLGLRLHARCLFPIRQNTVQTRRSHEKSTPALAVPACTRRRTLRTGTSGTSRTGASGSTHIVLCRFWDQP